MYGNIGFMNSKYNKIVPNSQLNITKTVNGKKVDYSGRSIVIHCDGVFNGKKNPRYACAKIQMRKPKPPPGKKGGGGMPIYAIFLIVLAGGVMVGIMILQAWKTKCGSVKLEGPQAYVKMEDNQTPDL